MRPVTFLPGILLTLVLFLFPLCAQTHKALAAAPPAISDAEVQQLVQAVSAHNWDNNDWDKIVHPAIKKIAALDLASRQKLVQPLEDLLDNEDLLGNAENALSAVAEPALPSLITIAQKSIGNKQKYAVGAIGGMGPKAKTAIPTLLSLAKTTDPKLRDYVVGALGKIGPSAPGSPTIVQTVNILIAALKDNIAGSDSSLGSYGAPAVPELRKILQTSTDVALRTNAIKAFAAMGAPAGPAAPELMVAVKDPATRVDAIWALNKIGLPAKQAVPILKKVVLKDPEYWIAPKNQYAEDYSRKYAIQALSKMDVENDFIIQCMKDDVPGAIDALSSKGVAVLPAMRAMLNEGDSKSKRMAMSVLSGMGAAAHPAVPDLIQCMSDPDLRQAVIRTLGNIGPGAEAAVPTLIHSLLENKVRFEAILALGNIGPAAKDAVPFLIDILQGNPQFTTPPPPPGYHYVYGEKAGELGRMMADVMDQYQSREALTAIGTPEALKAVKEYDAKNPK